MQNQLLQKIKYVYLLLNSIKCARNIMGVFKDGNVRIAFKANSTINNDLQNCEQCNQYENSGNYQLLSHNCGDMLALASMLHLDDTFCRTHIRLNNLNKHILMQDMLIGKITMLCV